MNASKYEWQQMVKIAERADALYQSRGMDKPHRLTLLMDLEHAHDHIPMDLGAMIEGLYLTCAAKPARMRL